MYKYFVVNRYVQRIFNRNYNFGYITKYQDRFLFVQNNSYNNVHQGKLRLDFNKIYFKPPKYINPLTLNHKELILSEIFKEKSPLIYMDSTDAESSREYALDFKPWTKYNLAKLKEFMQ